MKRNLFLACCLLSSTLAVQAQTTEGGGIDEQMLQKIAAAQKPAGRAVANAIASNSIDDLARNFQNAGTVDNYFSVETPKQSIHDQKSSGRC